VGKTGKDVFITNHHKVITGETGKFGVCNDHHGVITYEEVEKLRYVMIIMKL